jgi:hypothetical protein
MKKLIILLLAGIILLVFASCGGEMPAYAENDDPRTAPTSPIEAEVPKMPTQEEPQEIEEPDIESHVGNSDPVVPIDEPESFQNTSAHRLSRRVYGDYEIVMLFERIEYENIYHIVVENAGVETDRMNVLHYWWWTGNPAFSELGIEPAIIISDEYYSRNLKLFTLEDEKFLLIDFYEDGIKLDYIGHPIVTGIPISDNSFKTFYADFPDRNFYGEVIFTYDYENNRFNGVSQKFNPEEGSLKIAFDFLEKLNTYEWKVYYTRIKTIPNETWTGAGFADPYSKITEEGFRTEDEYIATLNEIFTEEFSRKIYAQLFVEFERCHGDRTWIRQPYLVEREDGLYHIIKDGFGDDFVYGYYIDIIYESDEKIETNVYTLGCYDGIYDILHNFDTMTIEKNADGEWRISHSSVADNI